ncbi:hypothetical protein BJF95_12150 [Rhizobium oryziradicis]|uniref:Uncharacterized protein n=1 Tax=Rhizobium oryziradicis TaxID=1867956 RepID=A0A1Q8ZUX3_9HYPH|nr:hypothetical protein BJF95_12150 [Rhizobium oryziradicis]
MHHIWRTKGAASPFPDNVSTGVSLEMRKITFEEHFTESVKANALFYDGAPSRPVARQID